MLNINLVICDYAQEYPDDAEVHPCAPCLVAVLTRLPLPTDAKADAAEGPGDETGYPGHWHVDD